MNKTNYLVIDHNNPLASNRYRLFEVWEEAASHAKSKGWQDQLEVNFDVGQPNTFLDGKIHVTVIRLQVA